MGIEKYIDNDLLSRFEFYNYGHALEILHDAFSTEWNELQDSLRKLRLTLTDVKKLEEMNHQFQRNLMIYCIRMDGGKLELVGI